MKRKLIFVVVLLLTGIFVSCSSGGDLSSQNAESVESVALVNNSISDLENFVDDREKTLTVLLPNMQEFDDLHVSAMNKYLYDIKTDYKIEFIYSHDMKVLEFLGQGNSADLFFSWEDFVGEEKIEDYALNLGDYLKSENGKALQNAVPEYLWQEFVEKENTYGIYLHYPVTAKSSYIVNKDLMEKYGYSHDDFKVPVDAISPMLNEVSDGEGIRPLLLENLQGISDGYTPAIEYFSIDRETKEVDYFFDTPESKKLIESVDAYVNDGLVLYDPIDTVTDENWFVFYSETYEPHLENHREFLAGKNGEDYIVVAIDDNTYVDVPILNGMSVSKNSLYTEESLDFLTKMVSDKNLVNLIVHGIENVHYTLDEEGKILPVYNAEEQGIYEDYIYNSSAVLIGNKYLSKALYNEFENKAEIIIDYEKTAVKSEFSKLDINELINEGIKKSLLEKTIVEVEEREKAYIKQMYAEEWEEAWNEFGKEWADVLIEDVKKYNIYYMGFNMYANAINKIFDSEYSGDLSELMTEIRNGFDNVGGRELVAEIERILSE